MNTFSVWLREKDFVLARIDPNTRRPEVIDNNSSSPAFPYLISFSKKGINFNKYENKVGKDNYMVNIENIGQLIGRDFNENIVKILMKRNYYTIDDNNGKPIISVKVGEKINAYSPESLFAIILNQIIFVLNQRTHFTINSLIFVVPEYYTIKQFEILKYIAKQLGIKEVQVQYESQMFACFYDEFSHSNMKKMTEFSYCSLYDNSLTFSKVRVTEDRKVIRLLSKNKILKKSPADFLLKNFVETLEEKGVEIKKQSNEEDILRDITEKTILILKNEAKAEVDFSLFVPEFKKVYTVGDFKLIIDSCLDEVTSIVYDNIDATSNTQIAFVGDIADIPFLVDACLPNSQVKKIDLPRMITSCAIGAINYAINNYKIVQKIWHDITIYGGKPNKHTNDIITFIGSPKVEYVIYEGRYKLHSNVYGSNQMIIPIYEGSGNKLSNYCQIGLFSFTHIFNESNRDFDFSIKFFNNGKVKCSVKGSDFFYEGAMHICGMSFKKDMMPLVKDAKNILEIQNIISIQGEKFRVECNNIKETITNSNLDKEIIDITNDRVNSINAKYKSLIEEFPTKELIDELKELCGCLEEISICCFM